MLDGSPSGTPVKVPDLDRVFEQPLPGFGAVEFGRVLVLLCL